jgi:hypothetical protein
MDKDKVINDRTSRIIAFLKDNNVFHNYVKYRKCDIGEYYPFRDLNTFFNLISQAFIWSDTEEGPYFWSKLDNELKLILSSSSK